MSTESPLPFEYRQEYDSILKHIAHSDIVDSEPLDWDTLRNAIKYKIDKNILAFLYETKPPVPPRPFEPISLPLGGLKLPPFPPRKITHMIPNETLVSYMNDRQANELKHHIFAQLHEFDSPPFTIQRLCELCVYPRKQYKSVGKYLRAVEKSILVTSTWDSFPAMSEKEQDMMAPGGLTLCSGRHSTPATPLFSPIPFLHDDARRSKSRSPPPSPLALGPVNDRNPNMLETKALGLIDELDDPSPGHMSDRPTALTSVTTVTETGARPLIGSLEDRFVKSRERHRDRRKVELDGNEEDNKA
ncbi:hypothetical protein AX17_005113 [Amanita inopinata Kibby_2008]|nr:hypothetical protein AX17_005113 [Amanita inopinata Kibby_2008]